MQALQDSAFLQALGFAVINSLWQAALLWTIVSVVNGLVVFSPETKYRLSLAAQLLAFIWFIATIYSYSNAPETLYPVINTTNINVFISSAVRKAGVLIPFLSLGYLLMLLIKFIQWLNEYHHVQHIYINELRKIPPEWRIFVQRLSGHFGIKKKVQIFLSGLVSSPLTIGYLKPIILIPLASINNLSAEQMEAIIVHELAHIKRADYLFNFLQSLVELVFFFNPFIQLLGREINKERENTCDGQVLQFQYNPIQYAAALLQLATLRNNTALALQASGNENGELLSRVRRILDKKEKKFQYRNHTVSILLLAVLFPYYIYSSGTKKSLMQKNNYAEVSIAAHPKMYPDNFSLKTGSRFKNPLEQIIYKPLNNLSAFRTIEVKNVAKENEKVNSGTTNTGDQELKTIITSEPVIENEPVSFASYHYYTNDSLPDAVTPFFHANIAPPEISAEQAYEESYINYLKAAGLSKQIEDSTLHISVKGNEKNKSSYRKIITIETTDSTGEKHSYNISLEVYQ